MDLSKAIVFVVLAAIGLVLAALAAVAAVIVGVALYLGLRPNLPLEQSKQSPYMTSWSTARLGCSGMLRDCGVGKPKEVWRGPESAESWVYGDDGRLTYYESHDDLGSGDTSRYGTDPSLDDCDAAAWRPCGEQ